VSSPKHIHEATFDADAETIFRLFVVFRLA
jgi:hypothetical protein